MIKADPLISVIVPVYKVEKYLEKCVQSIQNQTYRNLEIILVDDGSPDRCGELCDELGKADIRIRVLHRENGGQAAARNSGLAVASGELIGFVDSDDTIDPDMFRCLCDALLENNAELAMCNARSIAEDGSVLKAHNSSGSVATYKGKAAYDQLIPTLNNSVWNKLFQRDLLSGIEFPVGRVHGEDFIFLLEYLKKVHTIAVVAADKYNYLQRSGSITGSVFSVKKMDEIGSKDEIFQIVSEYYNDYTTIAKKWCFTARMNVMRGIVSSEEPTKWKDQYEECAAYLKQNHHQVVHTLSTRERLEALVMCYFPVAYPILLKVALKAKQ